MKKPDLQLGRRNRPAQQRSQDTVETMLETAAVLLDEVGVEAFNTNLLAQRSNLRIRTIYRYFPNKYAVILALTERLSVDWDRSMSRLYQRLANPKEDWRDALMNSRDDWLIHSRRVPGAISVLQAMNATPALSGLHFRIFEDMSVKTAAALRSRGVRAAPTKMLAIARTLINAVNSGMDVYLRLPPKEARLFRNELNRSLVAYLEDYLS